MKRYNMCSTVLACLAICAGVVSCSSDDKADTTQPVPAATSSVPSATDTVSAAACADRAALRDSIAALADVDVIAEGTNGLTAAVDKVKSDLDIVRASAGSVVGPQVQAVQDAIAAAQTGIENLGQGGAAQVTAALTALSTAVTALLSTLETGPCG